MWLSVGVALLGLLIYALSSTTKPAEVGRVMFLAGLFVFLLHSDYIMRLFNR